jgi:hypothetical protein
MGKAPRISEAIAEVVARNMNRKKGKLRAHELSDLLGISEQSIYRIQRQVRMTRTYLRKPFTPGRMGRPSLLSVADLAVCINLIKHF